MPFKSKKQSKACFATHGFGNKIDCDEWAKATDYKNIKKMGGKTKMGKCKYGCNMMQAGGNPPVIDDYAGWDEWKEALEKYFGKPLITGDSYSWDEGKNSIGRPFKTDVRIKYPAENFVEAGGGYERNSNIGRKHSEFTFYQNPGTEEWDGQTNPPATPNIQTTPNVQTTPNIQTNPLGQSPWLANGQSNPLRPAPMKPGTEPYTVPIPQAPNTPRTVAPTYNPFGESPWLPKGMRNPLVSSRESQIPMEHETFHGRGVEGYQEWQNGLPDDHPDKDINSEPAGRTSSITTTTTAPYHNWNTDVYLGLRGAQTLASYLASKKNLARMNQYDYKQKSALGQMNPMPISQFQYSDNDYTTPNRMYAQQGGTMNPYSYHSKYGGNLKTIIRDYNKWSNDAGPMDMNDGELPLYPERKKGGFALDEMVVRDYLSKLMRFGRGPHPYAGYSNKRYQSGGSAQASQQQQILQVIQAFAQMQGVDPKKILSQLKKMQPEQRQAALQQMAQAVQGGQEQGQQQEQQVAPEQAGMQMGGVPKPLYRFSALAGTPTSADSAQYRQAFNTALTTPQAYYDERNTLPAFRLAMQAAQGSPEANKWMNISTMYGNAYQDAHPPQPPYKGSGRMTRFQQGGTNPFLRPTPKLTQDVINYLHGLPSQEEQMLRGRNTVVAIPGGSSIPGDSTRYMTGRENQFGVPYTIDKLGVKGIMEGGADKFLGLPKDKVRVYQDSVLGNVNGFFEKGGNWIQGAVNPAHKGYCSPMTKATCTPRRKAFAMTMKKHHGFHK